MKDFRKTEDGLFICEECNIILTAKNSLSGHIKKCHFSIKEYYDKWLKEETEGICKICNKETKFVGFKHGGYKKICGSKECYALNIKKSSTHEVVLKRKQTCLEKHGNETYNNSSQNKITCLEHFGVEYSLQSPEIREKGKQTCREKYGDENYNNMEKNKQTKKELYGDENYHNIEKAKQTCLERFGVEYPAQCPEILHKGFIKSIQIKPYKNTGLWYQGSNEFDFLEKYYEKFKDSLYRGPTIKYFFNNNNRIYFSDFIIKSLNLVIECKNSYFMRRDKEEISAKKQATLATGFNYIIIVDKDYSIFNMLFVL